MTGPDEVKGRQYCVELHIIYLVSEEQRSERDNDDETHTHTHTYIYIYIYILDSVQ